MGKGSKRRPQQIDDDEMDSRWDMAFKRNKQNKEKNRYKRGQRREKQD